MQLKLYGKGIWLYRCAIDFRCGIDGLVGLISNEVKQNPQEGIYIFYNRHNDKVKGVLCRKVRNSQHIPTTLY